MIKSKKSFTILEVVISVMLLGLVLLALYKSADLLNRANKKLLQYVEKTILLQRNIQILYKDIIQSNGDIRIMSEDSNFHRLVIGNSRNSIHGLKSAVVTWLVSRNNNALVSLEGNNYTIPLQQDQRVEKDIIFKEMELFNVYEGGGQNHSRDILVVLKAKEAEPITFMIQALPKNENKSSPPNPNGTAPGLNNQPPPIP